LEKHAQDLRVDVLGPEGALNAVFTGTAVISGSARALACRTGAGSTLGEVAHALEAPAPPSAFEEGTRQFGLFILRFTLLLVIFVIRTRLNPLRARPHPWLVAASLLVVTAAVLLPFTPLSAALAFVPPPLDFFLALAATVVAHLACAERIKRWFYRRVATPAPGFAARGLRPATPSDARSRERLAGNARA